MRRPNDPKVYVRCQKHSVFWFFMVELAPSSAFQASDSSSCHHPWGSWPACKEWRMAGATSWVAVVVRQALIPKLWKKKHIVKSFQHQPCTKFQHVPSTSNMFHHYLSILPLSVTHIQARQSLFQVKHDFLHILCPFFCDLPQLGFRILRPNPSRANGTCLDDIGWENPVPYAWPWRHTSIPWQGLETCEAEHAVLVQLEPDQLAPVELTFEKWCNTIHRYSV